jgi:hypothetical protein
MGAQPKELAMMSPDKLQDSATIIKDYADKIIQYANMKPQPMREIEHAREQIENECRVLRANQY